MAAVAESIVGADGALNVVLGVGMVLLFAGMLVRALAARTRCAGVWRRRCQTAHAVGATFRARLHAAVKDADGSTPGAFRSSCSASRRSVRAFTGVPGPVVGPPVVDAPEPELTRLRAETLAPLAGTLDESRRLRAAEARVADELAGLPDGLWLVERDVLVGVRRIPFLVLGATGVFAICATDGAWTLEDLRVMSELGGDVHAQLPGYDGPVHGLVCLAFDDMKPRAWFGGEPQRGRGGWVLGVAWLQAWMFGFGHEHGLRNGDVRQLDEASGPFWNRRSSARLPATRSFG